MNASNPEGSEPRRESGPQEATNAHLSPQGPPAAGQQVTSPHASSGYPVYPAYPNNSSSGNQSAQFGESTAVTEAGGNALRYHGQQLADGLYGDGTELHPINNPAANGWMHTKGTGRLRIGEALSWPLKAFAANPGTLFIMGVVYAAIGFLPSNPSFPLFAAFVVMAASLLITPVIFSVVLEQTLVREFTSVKAPAYGKTLGMFLILAFIWGGTLGVVGGIGSIIGFASIDISALPDDPETIMSDPALLEDITRRMMGVTFGVVGIVGLLLAPLLIFPVFYAADNNRTFGYAFGEGIKAGARNYLTSLGFTACLMGLYLIGAAPMIFALTGSVSPIVGSFIGGILNIFIAPYALLAVAHAYRQVSGGPVPHHVEAAAVTTTEAPVS